MRILTYPDDTQLSLVSSEVDLSQPGAAGYIAQLGRDLRDSCGPNLGLAAPQIGIQKRVVYIAPWDVILVNPVVTPVGVTTSREYEECLSCPGMRVMVTRHIMVSITSVIQYVMSSKSGFWDRFVAMGLTARIVQHEVDHLDGILIASRLVDDLMGDADDQQPLYTPKRSKKASRKYTQEEKWQQ